VSEKKDTALRQLWERARKSWANVPVPFSEFSRFVEERGAAATLNTDDLYLACALAAGQKEAVPHLERSLARVPEYLQKAGLSAFADEVQQLMRTRVLLASADGAPLILRYSGRGNLGGWLRVVAVRLARDLERSRRRRKEGVLSDGLSSGTPDAEDVLVHKEHQQEFRLAFERAISSLSSEDRNILSLHFVEGLTTDTIAKLFKVDGSTIRRRIARLRDDILRGVTGDLRARLGLNRSTLASMTRVVGKELELSLTRLLEKK
jgi:RNA polymerase sigma-70 factor (ECF subfamily)